MHSEEVARPRAVNRDRPEPRLRAVTTRECARSTAGSPSSPWGAVPRKGVNAQGSPCFLASYVRPL